MRKSTKRTFIVRLADERLFYIDAYTRGEVPLVLEMKYDISREEIESIRRIKSESVAA